MDELIEEYERYEPLIGLLSTAIGRWENEAVEFVDFNRNVTALDNGVAVLRTLMDQYHLKTHDFKNEIGGKSMVSMILKGSRKLSKDHSSPYVTALKSALLFFLTQSNM
jgi:HTH-type transcriptional regulator/antitoxin HigA